MVPEPLYVMRGSKSFLRFAGKTLLPSRMFRTYTVRASDELGRS